MSGTGRENIFEGLAVKPECQHRSLQLCKEQREPYIVYVCGRCSAKFKVELVPKPQPKPREPMFPGGKYTRLIKSGTLSSWGCDPTGAEEESVVGGFPQGGRV